MRPEKRRAAVIGTLLVLSVPTAVLAPFLLRTLIDDVLPRRDLRDVIIISSQMVGLSLISGLLGYLQSVLAIGVHNRVRFRITRDLFAHVLRLPLGWIHKHSTGYLMSRMRDDITALESVMVDQFLELLVAVLKAVTFLVLLFHFDVGLALSGALLVGLILGLVSLVAPALRRRSQKTREADARSSAALHEPLTGIMTVRTSAQEAQEGRRYRSAVKSAIRALAKRDVLAVLTGSAFSSMGVVGIYVIIAVGAYRISIGLSTFGSLFAFFIALMQVMMATGIVAAMVPGIQASLASLERIFELLDEQVEEDGSRTVTAPKTVVGEVRLNGVTFRYDGGPLVLDGVDLVARPGTVTALVGRSGAGKSTLVHLISRLYDPVAGEILLDGTPLERYPLRWLRKRIGVVPQDVFLFDRTIRENIAYSRPDASAEEVREAARAAHAHDFIAASPHGYDSMVGERGVKLSGGEKQRLAIARELLRDPPILILDEATSNLDAESEALVREAIVRLMRGRTCFVIAHRLSTVLRADQIAVLDQGRLVALGTHAELLEEDGIYRQLYRFQFLDDAADRDPT